MRIHDDNSFAAACYNQNSVCELEEALTGPADETDCTEWRLTDEEWREAILDALADLRERDAAEAV